MGQKYADDAFFLSLYPQFLTLQRAQWRVTVLSAVAGTDYAIEVENDPPHEVKAGNGETITTLRNKLKLAVNNASLLVVTAANLADQLVLKEVTAGSISAIAVSPQAGLELEQTVPSDKYGALRAAWIEVAKEWIDLCAWGEKADAGHAALTAHFIAKAIGTDPLTGLATNKIGEMKLGPAQVKMMTTNVGSISNGYFGSTGYGETYLEMRSALVLTPVTDICMSFC